MTALKQLTKPPQQHSNTPKSTQIALDTTTTAYDSTTSATTTGPHWHSTATRLPQNHHNIRQHQHSHSTATALAQNYHNSCPHHHCAHHHKPPKHNQSIGYKCYQNTRHTTTLNAPTRHTTLNQHSNSTRKYHNTTTTQRSN